VNAIRQRQLFQHDRNLAAVRRGPGVQVYHRVPSLFMSFRET
jgi:hypothetical protein